MQEAGRITGRKSCNKCHNQGKKRIDAMHYTHGTRSSTERKAALNGQICIVQNLIGQQDSDGEDTVSQTLRRNI